jgi:ATP-dependent RNA helicase SUPV3L1/SUV3
LDTISDVKADDTEGSAAQSDEVEEEKTLRVWRYQRGQINRAAQGEKPQKKWQNNNKSSGKFKGKSGKNNKSYQGKSNHKQSFKPKDKPMDPDSPFAKLAMLKDNLRGK